MKTIKRRAGFLVPHFVILVLYIYIFYSLNYNLCHWMRGRKGGENERGGENLQINIFIYKI
jgi:hypothetical protein